MGYTPSTIDPNTFTYATWANKIENELGTVGSYLGRVSNKGQLNNLTASYKDFAWVDDEQAFYWYAGNGWFPYDVKRLKEGFTLVNLLGSYGGFDKDSNGDGVADGWKASGATDSLITGVSGYAQQGTETYSSGVQAYMHTFSFEPRHKYFASWYVKVNRLDGYCGNLGYFTIGQKFLYIPPTVTNIWQNKYGSFTTKVHDYGEGGFYLYVAGFSTAIVGETYTAAFDNFCLYDLTWMDQYSPMPQSLQEKYAVSKWVDMTDDDLANELPYVDGVAYVGVGL